MVNKRKHVYKFILIFSFFQILTGGNIFMSTAQGQTPTPTPDIVLEAAKREAELAKARAEQAEAEKEVVEAERDKLKATIQPFGTPAVTAPNGGVTPGTNGFVETKILGQEAARVITYRFAKEITDLKLKPKNIIIYNSGDIAALAVYAPIVAQLKRFNLEFTQAQLNTGKILATNDISQSDFGLLTAPAIAAGVIKSVAELAQLFRSETKFSNNDVPVSEDTIVSYLVNRMSKSGIKIYYPAFFPVELAGFGGDKEGISDEFGSIQKNKFIAANNVKDIDAKIAELTKDKETKKTNLANATGNSIEKERIASAIKDLDEWLENLGDMKTNLLFLISSAELIIKGLETPDATTKITPLTQLIRSAHLQRIMNAETKSGNAATDDTYTLRFNVAANGTTKIKQWFFLDAKVRHSAGARVTYQLFDKNGLIVQANSFQFYYDWKSSEEVRACLDQSCISESEEKQNYVTP